MDEGSQVTETLVSALGRWVAPGAGRASQASAAGLGIRLVGQLSQRAQMREMRMGMLGDSVL